MAGPSALVLGTKRSVSSTLGKNLQKFLEGHSLPVFVAENPKDVQGKGPFTYAVLVVEEPIPPMMLNVWFKVFVANNKISDRLFLLSKTELPEAWQANLPIESTFEESNYQAVLQEIIDPGKHLQKSGEFRVGEIQSDSEGGMFDLAAAGNSLSIDESPASADDAGFFSSDLSQKLSLNAGAEQIEQKKTNAGARPAPPTAKKPPAPLAMKMGLPSNNPPNKSTPTAEAATKMVPLPGKKLPPPPVVEDSALSLEAAPELDEPSIQFDLSEDTSAIDNVRVNESNNLDEIASASDGDPKVNPSEEDLGFESANQATRVSKPLSMDDELPPAKNVKLSLGVPVKSQEKKQMTGSIHLEALEHPEGTRLNEPLAGRGEDVNMDELALEEAQPPEESSFNPHAESPIGSDELSVPIGDEFEMSSDAESSDVPDDLASTGASKSEIKTLEKYLAIKDRELRERESNIKILKGQIQKTEAKLLKSDDARRAQAMKLDETQAEIRALREESEQKAFQLQKVEDLHREEMKALQARMEGALFEANKAGKRLDEFRERVKQDIQKIRAQERELANKLEIQKRDADALLGAKDEKLMAQRREIDQLQFELDNLKERLVEETEKAEERSKRLSRALSSLKLAQGMLSGIKEEVVPSSDDDSSDDGEAA